MKSDFLQPKFEGARFAEHTLPLEVARDLAAYETLVVELAKHLYLEDHPDRKRVLKGFASDFHLHLERVDDGSAKPLLSVVMAGALALNAGSATSTGSAGTHGYFEKARDLITQCIAAPEGNLPPAFPRGLLAYFNQVGRSLREDERMELPTPNGPAVLTPERRKKLVLAAESVYEREIELVGTIGEADWEKSTFRLRFPDNNYAVVPMPKSFHSEAREYGGRNRFQVTIKGVGAFDSWDKLQKIVSVESLDIQPDYQLSARFDALLKLSDGWFDGKGVAPDKAKLSLVAENLVGHYPENLPLPAIVPTQDGNLLFEWEAAGEPSLDLDLKSMVADFHAFLPGDKEIDQQISLPDETSWLELFKFLTANIQAPSNES